MSNSSNASNPSKATIIVHDRDDLEALVTTALKEEGPLCNLNHLDVSRVKHFFNLFRFKEFNGDISQWDVSGGEHFMHMFQGSTFSGDVCGWSMTRAKSITGMFQDSPFAGDLSAWNFASLDPREGNRFVAHRDTQARLGMRLPVVDIPAPVLFNTTPDTMHAWLAAAAHSRYHWDALLVGEAPWATDEMVEHLHKMRPLFELLGLSGVALAQTMEESWGAGDAPSPITAWPADFESPA